LKEVEIHFKLNGKNYDLVVGANLTLLQIIREKIGITGTKRGCDKGECGACTVIFNGRAVSSCLLLAPKVDGSEVITVEGIGTYEKPHPIQEAFCGSWCSTVWLLHPRFYCLLLLSFK